MVPLHNGMLLPYPVEILLPNVDEQGTLAFRTGLYLHSCNKTTCCLP